jgi:hypothetical protein
MKRFILILTIPFMLFGCHSYKVARYSNSTPGNISLFDAQFRNVAYYKSDTKKSYEREKNNYVEDIKIIYNAYIRLIVKQPDSLSQKLKEIAVKYDGYLLSAGSDEITIRVIADKLENAISDIEKEGKVDYKNISGEDVTEQFSDFEIRLDNAMKARKRYLELLENAANVSEALEVEKELERLNNEIELLKGKLKRMEHLVSYSTIRVGYQEKVKPGVLGYIGIGTYKFVKWFFVRN